MFYEVYIDVFFAVNAMLDFFVIQLARKIQHYKSTNLRIVLASMTGSAILCIFICLPIRRYLLVRMLFYIGAFAGMSLIAFPYNRKKGIVKAVVTLYGVSLLINGIYQWLSLQIEHGYQVLLMGIFIYVIISLSWFVYKQRHGPQQHIYQVHLWIKQREVLLQGLWDTGNRLCSPYDGKGISIIDYECIREFISEDEKFFFVPYQTVGCAHGLMKVITVDKMVIEKEGEMLEYIKPLLGISKTSVSKGNGFQIVLTTNVI